MHALSAVHDCSAVRSSADAHAFAVLPKARVVHEARLGDVVRYWARAVCGMVADDGGNLD